MKSNYKNIFTPLTIKNMTMRNRIMMTPMGTNYGEQTGEMSFLHIDYYTERAKGGVGLIMVENASVDSPLGSNGTTQIRIDHDNYMPRFFKLCETLHAVSYTHLDVYKRQLMDCGTRINVNTLENAMDAAKINRIGAYVLTPSTTIPQISLNFIDL